jgi:hypothetical protein
VVAAGGPGDPADGVDLGDQGLALAIGAPFGPGRQPLAPSNAEGAEHGAGGEAEGGLAGKHQHGPGEQRADTIPMGQEPPGVDVEAQEVREAVAGRLKHRHFDAEQGGGGEEDGLPGKADLADDHRSGDQGRRPGRPR